MTDTNNTPEFLPTLARREGFELRIFVPGTPRPQGSVRPVVSKSTGRAFVKQSPTLAEWRNAIFVAAREAMEQNPEWVQPAAGEAVVMTCQFRFLRPKSHTKKRRREEGWLKPDGSDLDKLVRAVGDGLTVAGVYEDDRQIVRVLASKCYVEPPEIEGALIGVTRVSNPLGL